MGKASPDKMEQQGGDAQVRQEPENTEVPSKGCQNGSGQAVNSSTWITV